MMRWWMIGGCLLMRDRVTLTDAARTGLVGASCATHLAKRKMMR